ncbi:MAG: ferrous iron transport protein [Pseudomonadota bacterium]|nr:ferrous iron transport protein [Pseudomonadota bacterium]
MKLVNLTELKQHDVGIVRRLDESCLLNKIRLSAGEVESRLLDMGIIEGAQVTVMHIGRWGREPIAIRINNSSSLIALRKNEAAIILLEMTQNNGSK